MTGEVRNKRLSLAQQLEELTTKLRALVPAPRLQVIDRAIAELQRSNAAARALKPGDQAPTFELPDGDGMIWRSADLLRNGPLVLVFYRGRWCAYCNAQLAALQQIHPRIATAGASLVAVSPQTQKHSYLTRDMHHLRFPVLSDAGNQVARQFGLVYRIPLDLQTMYESIFTRLPGYNGDASWELPLAATYIILSDAAIAFAEIREDWRQRAEPDEVLSRLSALLH